MEIKEKINNGITAVLFTANWCGPCKMMKPEFEKVKNNSTIAMEVVDIDIENELTKEKNIRAVPTMKIFKDGSEVYSHSGFMGERQIFKIIEQYG